MEEEAEAEAAAIARANAVRLKNISVSRCQLCKRKLIRRGRKSCPL
jgi:hypothetical protein